MRQLFIFVFCGMGIFFWLPVLIFWIYSVISGVGIHVLLNIFIGLAWVFKIKGLLRIFPFISTEFFRKIVSL